MKPVVLVIMVAALITGCGGRTATITVDPGFNGASPVVDCHAVITNPDYQPTTESKKP
jgi:hypothetical protein